MNSRQRKIRRKYEDKTLKGLTEVFYNLLMRVKNKQCNLEEAIEIIGAAKDYSESL